MKNCIYRQQLLSPPLERGGGGCYGKFTHPFIPSF